MSLDFILPVIIFAVSMSITPGPNNIMLTASGANFGFIKTIPHILGIVTGIAFMNILSAVGLSKLFNMFPNIQNVLKYIGIVYMMFLAYKIAFSAGVKNSDKVSKPLNFFQAMLFQALNPKAIIMCITAITVYSLEGRLFYKSVVYILVIFLLFGVSSISIWAGFGTILKRILKNRRYLKIFNYFMGFMCCLSAIILLK
ncbi:MAG: LysE family translocator [Spirochaetaceae bacterium]